MVEWKKLGELGTFENIGTDKKIVEGEDIVTLLNYIDVYHHKYIDSSVPQMQVSASNKKIADCTVEKGDIFVTPSSETLDDIGHSSVITETITNAVYSYHIMRYRLFEKNMLLSYYINYSFDTDNVKRQILKKAQGLTRFGLSKDKFASILIPIPSLSEQQRIVGILDTFTASIDNLKEQIAQRRKQYEYYRDQLLDLEGKEGVEMKTLGESCLIRTGSKPAEILDKGRYCYINAGTTESGYVNESNCDCDVVTTPSRGQGGIGFVGYQRNDFWLGPLCYQIRPNKKDNFKSKYLFYYLSSHSEEILKYKSEGGTPAVNAVDLKKIQIHLPPLQEQQRIVSILDTFEASIQNLEAQLSQREKQYEYYRNKLLTFE